LLKSCVKRLQVGSYAYGKHCIEYAKAEALAPAKQKSGLAAQASPALQGVSGWVAKLHEKRHDSRPNNLLRGS